MTKDTMTEHHDAQPAEPEHSRRVLIDVAYRMLGSLADAEDAAQEAFIRWYRLDPDRRAEVDSVTGWLVRATSRICLDVLGSAHRRRQQYPGDWLPEPIPTSARWRSDHAASDTVNPADRVTLDESVSTALLVVLDTLSPAERVAFVLHDVFGHSFAEVAATVGRSPAACRQLASSARRRITAGTPARTAGHADAALVAAVQAAWQAGDLDTLTALLDPDVVATIDSGGLVSAPPHPVHGAGDVARMLLDVPKRQPGITIHTATVNGRPGLEAGAGGSTLAVISIATDGERISRLWIVRNPAKLTAWQPTSSEP